MRRTLLAFLLFILGSGLLQAQAPKINFTEYDLDNGMHVILHKDNSVPVVAVTIMYHVGSKNENPERTGFAHFFEHLMFEGSKNIPRGEYSKHVEKAGGVLNANTTWDRTFYYELLPSNQLELGLWLESERLLHGRVDSIGIKTQKGVVCEEIKQRVENTPYGSILQEVTKRAFKKHPYKWTVLGSADHIHAASDQDVLNFYKTFYVPNNAVLVIAGDIDIDETKEKVKKYFGSIPKGTKEIYRPKDNEPALSVEVRDTIFDNIQLPAVIQAYRTPKQGTKDYYAMEMLSRVLSRGNSSRLYRSLVDEKQMALQVMAQPLPFEHSGLTLTFALPNIGIALDKVEAAMDAEMDKVKKELITEKEFEKLKNQIENQFVHSNSTIESRAGNLATYYTFFKNANLVNTELSKYMQVTREDIQKVAKKYLTKKNRVVLYYVPKNAR